MLTVDNSLILTPYSSQQAAHWRFWRAETEREQIRANIIDEETRLARSRAAADNTERHIVRMLDDLSANVEKLPLGEQHEVLRGFIEHVEIDPATLRGRICYHFSALSGDKVASPRG